MCGHTFRFNAQHSCVDNNRMRLQMTFPELTHHDSESENVRTAYLHNSYNLSKCVRFIFGTQKFQYVLPFSELNYLTFLVANCKSLYRHQTKAPAGITLTGAWLI